MLDLLRRAPKNLQAELGVVGGKPVEPRREPFFQHDELQPPAAGLISQEGDRARKARRVVDPLGLDQEHERAGTVGQCVRKTLGPRQKRPGSSRGWVFGGIAGVDAGGFEVRGIGGAMRLQRVLHSAEPCNRISKGIIVADQQMREILLLIQTDQHFEQNAAQFLIDANDADDLTRLLQKRTSARPIAR